MSAIQQAIRNLTGGHPVDGELTGRVAVEILEGQATPAQIGAFLVALRIRGETAEQLGAFVKAMRAFATPVELADREKLVDTCGTGGDDAGTFNISTAAAIVAAGAGARIAKHGNKAVTSRPGAGSADVLAALGVTIDCSPACSVRCLDQCGLAFFFAPAYHGAMRHAGPARREIGVRTILNLLGPMANPAGTRRQLIGVGTPELTETFAQVLGELGSTHIMVVHGNDGLDEITLTGLTTVAEYKGGALRRYQLDPRDLGLSLCRLEDLAGGATAEARAAEIREILDGRPGPKRRITELNAAAALVVADVARDFADGLRLAAEAIDSGRAREVIGSLARISSGEAEPAAAP